MIQTDRELEIVIQWKQKSTQIDLTTIEDLKFQSINLDGSGESFQGEEGKSGDVNSIPKNNETTIFDCLDRFQHEEMLSGNDKWYCPRCKDHVSALKKIQIYKLPEYLIVHFKRFSHQGRNSSRKISKTIEFPLENFDMSQYCKELANKSLKSCEKISYNLYAISNHIGSLNGGHYTAFCKNPIQQQWYLFDDRTFEKVSDLKNMVGSSAYVLFYKLNTK